MENKIPTAEEFWLQNNGQHQNTAKMMIEFAKLHVEAALKEASENAKIIDVDKCVVYKFSILNTYPLTNIK